VIGAELHLDVKTVLWQETTVWQEGSESVAGNGDVSPAPVSRARRSTFPAGFRVSRSQGSLPDRNLGCSMHQAMSPLVQPELHTIHVTALQQMNVLACISEPAIMFYLGKKNPIFYLNRLKSTAKLL